MDNKRLGKKGEAMAQDYLQERGYQVLYRNFRAKQYGEVDIIAHHPNGKLLIFVEVKTRISDEFGRPEEAITKGKLYELKKMVSYYYNQCPETSLSPQIDVIAVTLSPDETVQNIEHFENITL